MEQCKIGMAYQLVIQKHNTKGPHIPIHSQKGMTFYFCIPNKWIHVFNTSSLQQFVFLLLFRLWQFKVLTMRRTMLTIYTQVNRMSKSRRVLATGGKQRSFGLHMVCFEMVLYHNELH